MAQDHARSGRLDRRLQEPGSSRTIVRVGGGVRTSAYTSAGCQVDAQTGFRVLTGDTFEPNDPGVLTRLLGLRISAVMTFTP